MTKTAYGFSYFQKIRRERQMEKVVEFGRSTWTLGLVVLGIALALAFIYSVVQVLVWADISKTVLTLN